MSDTIERVKSITANILKIDQSKIEEESRFVEDLGAESIQSIEMIASFEEEFDIEMEEDDALKVKTVKDAADFIDACIEEQQ